MPESRVPARTLPDFALERAARTPEAIAFRQREGDAWQDISWREFVLRAQGLANGLAAIGLGRGSRVAIMAPTCLDWELFQLAALLDGAAVVGLDPHDQPARLQAMATAAAVDTVIVAGPHLLERLDAAALPDVRRVVCLSGGAAPPAYATLWHTPASLLAAGQDRPAMPSPQPEDLATIIFTSGSTGMPKGIAYTHAQVVLAVENILGAFPEIRSGDRLVCWLPLSNLFQRMLNYCAAGRGAESWFVAEPQTIIERLPEIRPHVFVAVPRFFEKLDEGIQNRITGLPRGARRLVNWALAVGMKNTIGTRAGRRPHALSRWRLALAERWVLRRLRAVLGGELRFLVSGSAPFPPWLLERFHGMGWLVLEAYGLSENVVPIALNRPAARRLGTVGQVLPANEVRIAPDGEVMVRGEGVCRGYLDGSPAALDAEGFLATGDLGALDGDGFLTLTGRKSELFKTSTGRKVAPLPVEAALRRVPGIDQAVLLGAGRKTPVALVTLKGHVSGTALEDSARAVAARVPEVLRDLPAYARPAGLLVLRRPLGIDTGELTSNLKLRRSEIASLHAEALDDLCTRLESTTPFAVKLDEERCLVRIGGTP